MIDLCLSLSQGFGRLRQVATKMNGRQRGSKGAPDWSRAKLTQLDNAKIGLNCGRHETMAHGNGAHVRPMQVSRAVTNKRAGLQSGSPHDVVVAPKARTLPRPARVRVEKL